MEYRNFGNSDLKTSVVGFGTIQLGKNRGPVADEQVVQAIHRALDLGVTCFDTAPIYGRGRSERILGKALGRRRRDVVLITKCGLRWDQEGKMVLNGTRDSILAEVEESLVRLGTDYIDLLLIHRPLLGAPLDETVSALQEARRSGKARYVGVSNFTVAQLEESLRLGSLVAHEVGYNLFDRRTEEIIAFCQAKGIGVITYGSLSFGLLTGTFTKDTQFADGVVYGQALFERENYLKNLEVVEQLKRVAGSVGKSLPQLALNWILSNPAITAALTGCRRPEEIEDNVGALGWTLSAADKCRIEAIMKGAAGLSDRPFLA